MADAQEKEIPPYMRGRKKKKGDTEERANAIARRIQKTEAKEKKKK